jgi:hypothetical protein
VLSETAAALADVLAALRPGQAVDGRITGCADLWPAVGRQLLGVAL